MYCGGCGSFCVGCCVLGVCVCVLYVWPLLRCVLCVHCVCVVMSSAGAFCVLYVWPHLRSVLCSWSGMLLALCDLVCGVDLFVVVTP